MSWDVNVIVFNLCLYLVGSRLLLAYLNLRVSEVLKCVLKESLFGMFIKMLCTFSWSWPSLLTGSWWQNKENKITYMFLLLLFCVIGNNQTTLHVSSPYRIFYDVTFLSFLYRNWFLNFIISLRCLSTSIIITLEWWMMGQWCLMLNFLLGPKPQKSLFA